MRFPVRNPAGVHLGSIPVMDLKWLERGYVRFVRALRPHYHGLGLREETESGMADPSFDTVEFKVQVWNERPTIGVNGGYRPGRSDFNLLWDGPVEHLLEIPAFESRHVNPIDVPHV